MDFAGQSITVTSLHWHYMWEEMEGPAVMSQLYRLDHKTDAEETFKLRTAGIDINLQNYLLFPSTVQTHDLGCCPLLTGPISTREIHF